MKKFICSVLMVGLFLINFGSLFVAPRTATAAALTVMSDTVTNLSAGAVANHLIKFTTPSIIPISGTITLTFDNSTNIPSGLDYTDIDLLDSTTDLPLAAAPSSNIWGVVRTSQYVLTFTNGNTIISAGRVITIKIGTNATYSTTGDQQITNGTAGTTTLRIVTSVPDSGVISMAIVSNGVVSLNAEVLSALSFTISDNTIYFGNLKSSGTSCWAQGGDPGFVTCPKTTEFEAFNMTAGTNGSTGYTISVQGDTLKSGATNNITALAASTAPAVGSEQFGIRIDESGGGGVVNATYGTTGQYAFTATAATPATVATATGPSATTTYSTRYMANISPVTEPGSYTTAHTYIATGNF